MEKIINRKSPDYTATVVKTAAGVANTDFEVRSLDTMCVNESQKQHPWWYNLKYTAVVFGIVFVKAEVISWFRIQEMFRLQSFHMYGVIGTAVVVGMISVALIKKLKTIYGRAYRFSPKKVQQRTDYWRYNFRIRLGINRRL